MKIRQVVSSAGVVAALVSAGGLGVTVADAGTTEVGGGGCPVVAGGGPRISLAGEGAGRVRLTVPASAAAGGGQVVEVATVAAARGPVGLDTTVSGSTVSGSTASGADVVSISRAAFTETLRGTPGGVEQSWTF